MDMSSSSSSDEDSDEGTNVKYQPPVIKLSPPPKRRVNLLKDLPLLLVL
jgi:hypothetical protein